jgi:hypothetical protein
MALEDRIHASIDAALADLNERVEREVRTTVEQLLHDAVANAHAREREAEMAALSRLLDSVRTLDSASTLSEVLDALGHSAGREASRAAVLVVRGNRLHGWRLCGFDALDTQPKSIDLSLNESGVIGLAVSTARPVTTRDSRVSPPTPAFAHLPADRLGFAVPVIVGTRVVAAVYADSAPADNTEHVVPSCWPEVIELLARHAARCLEALTVQKAARVQSQRFWVPAGGSQPTGSGASSSPTPDAAMKQDPDAPSGMNT